MVQENAIHKKVPKAMLWEKLSLGVHTLLQSLALLQRLMRGCLGARWEASAFLVWWKLSACGNK